MKRTSFALVLFVAGLAPCLVAQTKTGDLCTPPPAGVAPALPAKLMTGQGKIHFPITTSNPEAQAFFNQGVAQMHSFWAIEAERSFLQAAALDPAAPMPHWGIAMVAAGDYRPRFQLVRDTAVKKDGKQVDTRAPAGGMARAIAAARKALELAAVPGKSTPLERLYIASIAARRDADVKDKDDAYIRGLRAIVAAYPDQVEAASFLALHLMQGFTQPDRQPREGSMEAANLLREWMAKAPDHPGVHHYVIHGFEGSNFAKDAWTSCRRYPELTPNIPHALHMPGHIWAQTGKWDEAVKSFAAAAHNELGYIRADQLYSTGHHGHNVHFMSSSLSFMGNFDESMRAARSLLEFKENPREASQVDNFYTAWRQGWFSVMRALVQGEKWDLILEGKTLPEYNKPRERAWTHYARGLAHAAKGDAGAVKRELDGFDLALRDFEAKTGEEPPKPLQVARQDLEAHRTYAAGKVDQALKQFEAAMRAERALRYNEPPSYPRPVAEVLGQLALKHGKTALAEMAFREALDQYPESSRAVAGMQALKKQAPATGGF